MKTFLKTAFSLLLFAIGASVSTLMMATGGNPVVSTLVLLLSGVPVILMVIGDD